MMKLLRLQIVLLVLAAASSVRAGKVEIIRDSYGVPHVFARSQFDACLGLGYAQAEDNLDAVLKYVMDARAQAGRVAGQRQNIEQDFRFRMFRLPQISKALYEQMADTERSRSDGFAEGINTYLRRHPGRKPDWFDRMTGVDTVAVIKAYQIRQQWANVMQDMRGVVQTGREIDQAGGDDGGRAVKILKRPESSLAIWV